MRAQSVPVRKRPRITNEKRDQIVLDHLPLVKAIAIRVHESLPVHVDLDDLIHAGVMGLFDAVIKYDGGKNVVFHAYAKHRIKGAILDSLRQLDWASRDLHDPMAPRADGTAHGGCGVGDAESGPGAREPDGIRQPARVAPGPHVRAS